MAGRATAATPKEWSALGSSRARIEAAGRVGLLLSATLRALITPPFPWVRSAIVEFSLVMRRCTVPAIAASAAFATANALELFPALLKMIGGLDRVGAGYWIGSVREITVWITSMMLAGAAGSAVTADLGARKVRQEIDALTVLGTDLKRVLVAPRVIALVVAGPVLGLLAQFFVVALLYVAVPPLQGTPHNVYLETVLFNVHPWDLITFVIKLAIMGLFVGLVSCERGLSAAGGTEGVGRAVTQAVMVCFFGVWVLNTLFNLIYLTMFPSSSIPLG